jgi:hypothetical protein
VSPVRFELSFYIPEDGIHHSHSRENLKSYISIVVVTRPGQWRPSFSVIVFTIFVS